MWHTVLSAWDKSLWDEAEGEFCGFTRQTIPGTHFT